MHLLVSDRHRYGIIFVVVETWNTFRDDIVMTLTGSALRRLHILHKL